MTWLALGALGLLLLMALARGFANASVATVKAAAAWIAGGIGLALLAALLLSGRAGQALWALIFFGPLLLNAWRARRAGRVFSRGGQASPGQESHVETATLTMTLQHDTGRMTGVVKRGMHAGRDLADLDLPALRALLAECAAEDPDSVPLLEAWLDRSHPDWRDATAPEDGPISRDEAFALLGLAEGASVEEIRAAHRRLMHAAHPDRGGSPWLAARLNAARDFLLGR